MQKTLKLPDVNYDVARGFYPGDKYTPKPGSSKFAPAFLTTNEHLGESITAFGNNMGDVLTVAASGDQPLCYAGSGARRVDTFDISFCARVIMDLKTAAIQNLNHTEYLKLLNALHQSQVSKQNIMNVDGIKKVIQSMPAQTAQFIQCMGDRPIFSAGINGRTDFVAGQAKPHQYAQIQLHVNRPFSFIWSDVADLHTHLNTKYDVINVSNIFEWANQKSVAQTLRNLFQYLKPNGYILGTVFWSDGFVESGFEEAAKSLGNAARINYAATKREYLIALQRKK